MLTREGWLQPWVRTRKTEDEERKRLAAMPGFQTLSRVGRIKPGAVMLAQVGDAAGNALPALVAQPFGKGHVAALLIGDLWRWGMRRDDPEESDLERSWRQTVRWLVGDVPGRVEVAVRPEARLRHAGRRAGGPRPRRGVPAARQRQGHAQARPARRRVDLTLDAEPDGREAGSYAATYVPRKPGAYRVVATATAPDGSTVGEREAGWAAQPAADEFARLSRTATT